ncbi:magnesium transporter NIPA-domain-containing protein [Tuber indicum]|nr:magnesium transporter NIPA-domain-containing protein [Tuber indicum]
MPSLGIRPIDTSHHRTGGSALSSCQLGNVATFSPAALAMFKEPFRGRDLLGVVLGSHQILEAITQTTFEVYFGITCSLIALLMYISPKCGRKYTFIDLGLVGLFGGYTVLSTKGISSLLSSSFYRIFTLPIAYPLAIILVAAAILQVKYVNRALQRFDSTQVIPTQFVLFTISVILGSAILYRDFETVYAKNPDDESDYESDFDPVVGLEWGVVMPHRKSRPFLLDGADITSSSSEGEGGV